MAESMHQLSTARKKRPNFLLIVADDLGETNDLAAANPDKLKELLSLWEDYVEQTGVLLAPPA